MIKATNTNTTPALVSIPPERLTELAALLAKRADAGRQDIEASISILESDIESKRSSILDYQRYIEDNESDLEALVGELATFRDKLDALPPPPEPDEKATMAELDRIARLSWVKNVSIEQSPIAMRPTLALCIETRPNALYTTMTKRISSAGRFYTTTPYKIALPAYDIIVSLTPRGSLSNSDSRLAINLHDYESDTANFMTGYEYNHEPHAHWGARHKHDEFSELCLGEYENEINRAFRTSLFDGLVSLSIYLQIAGDRHAFVEKHKWALWLGKKEYNEAITPRTVAEKKKAQEADVSDCECFDEEDDRRCDEDCVCDCHN